MDSFQGMINSRYSYFLIEIGQPFFISNILVTLEFVINAGCIVGGVLEWKDDSDRRKIEDYGKS